MIFFFRLVQPGSRLCITNLLKILGFISCLLVQIFIKERYSQNDLSESQILWEIYVTVITWTIHVCTSSWRLEQKGSLPKQSKSTGRYAGGSFVRKPPGCVCTIMEWPLLKKPWLDSCYVMFYSPFSKVFLAYFTQNLALFLLLIVGEKKRPWRIGVLNLVQDWDCRWLYMTCLQETRKLSVCVSGFSSSIICNFLLNYMSFSTLLSWASGGNLMNCFVTILFTISVIFR